MNGWLKAVPKMKVRSVRCCQKPIAKYQKKVTYYQDRIASGKKCGTFPFRNTSRCESKLAKYESLLASALESKAQQQEAAASMTQSFAPSPMLPTAPVTADLPAPTSGGGMGATLAILGVLALAGGAAFLLIRRKKKRGRK